MDSLTLSIIEDEEAHFDLMKLAILKQLPYASVNHFEDAEACLQELEDTSPDIIITDYLLPGMNGIQFLEALNQKNRNVPVIMITGQGNENVAVRALKLGAWDYLVKSADFFSLLPRVIEKVFRERKLTESLRESASRFKDLAERTSEWIWEVDSEGKYIYSNANVEYILGYHPDEVVGNYFYDFLPGEKREAVRHSIFKTFEQKKPITASEYRLIHKNGHPVFVESSSVPFFDTSGNLSGYRGIHRDISARKRAEEALRESEEKFRNIFAQSPIGIGLYDSEGQLLTANKSYFEIFGIAEMANARGSNLFDDFTFPVDTKIKLGRGEIFRYETLFDFERIKRLKLYDTNKSGVIYLEVLITQLGLEEKESFSGYLVQIRDITKRINAQEHARRLSQQLMKAQEIERQRVAFDLHDHLAQDLSTIKIGLDTLFDNPPDDIQLETRQKVSELSRMVHHSITAVRDLAYGLRPPSLDQLGLVQTIRQHCEEFSKKNRLKVDFFSAGMDELTLDFDTEITLYRVIQEGLNNIKKHANATNVTLRLVASYPDIILRIQDNGKGFDLQNRLEAALAEKRMGIRSMEERVALVNGKMRIESRPMKGTKIFIELPYGEKRSG